MVEPDMVHPDVGEPDVVEPEVAEPEEAEPDGAEPNQVEESDDADTNTDVSPESFSDLSDDQDVQEPHSSQQNLERPPEGLRRSQRHRQSRKIFTYDRKGEPRIKRYSRSDVLACFVAGVLSPIAEEEQHLGIRGKGTRSTTTNSFATTSSTIKTMTNTTTSTQTHSTYAIPPEVGRR